MLLAAGMLTDSDIYEDDRPTFTAGAKFYLFTIAGHWFHSPCANFSTGPKTTSKNKRLFELFLNGNTQEQIAQTLDRKQSAVCRTLKTLFGRCMADYYGGKIPDAIDSWLKTHFSHGIPPDMEIAFFAAAGTRSGIEYPYARACEVFAAWLLFPGANFRTNDLSGDQNRQVFALYAARIPVPKIVRIMNLPQAKPVRPSKLWRFDAGRTTTTA